MARTPLGTKSRGEFAACPINSVRAMAEMFNAARQICEAVNARRRLRVRYKELTRILEPYLVGEYSDGRQFVLAWLVRCEDDPTKLSGWQHYLLTRIQALELLEEQFDCDRSGYNPVSDTRVERILCSVPVLRASR